MKKKRTLIICILLGIELLFLCISAIQATMDGGEDFNNSIDYAFFYIGLLALGLFWLFCNALVARNGALLLSKENYRIKRRVLQWVAMCPVALISCLFMVSFFMDSLSIELNFLPFFIVFKITPIAILISVICTISDSVIARRETNANSFSSE